MFGLTFEKLFLVALIAGVVIGPQRLPLYAHKVGETIRGLRRLLDDTRARTETELGVTRAEWEALDLRQFHPRHIVREALHEPVPTDETAEESAPDAYAEVLEQARRVRPGQQFLVTGSAAHPVRIRLDSLHPDDPRRLAAEVSG